MLSVGLPFKNHDQISIINFENVRWAFQRVLSKSMGVKMSSFQWFQTKANSTKAAPFHYAQQVSIFFFQTFQLLHLEHAWEAMEYLAYGIVVEVGSTQPIHDGTSMDGTAQLKGNILLLVLASHLLLIIF